MTGLTLHFLQAKGAWGVLRERVADQLQAAHRQASAVMAVAPLDVVLKFNPCPAPGLEVQGYAPEPRLIWINIDPEQCAEIFWSDGQLAAYVPA